MFSKVKVTLFLFAMAMVLSAGPSPAGTGTAAPVGPAPGLATLPPSGINVDVPFTEDPLCGFQIVLQGEKPTSFYNAGRNPWGPPTIQALGPNLWLLTFGGPSGPCVHPSDSIFWGHRHPEDPNDPIVFLGLHFGFYTNDPSVHLFTSGNTVSATCWLLGPHGWVPGPGLTGHIVYDWGLAVLNTNAQAFAVQNAQIAVSPREIEINSLTRNDLDSLQWQDLALQGNIVPAGSNDAPGTLDVSFPNGLRSQAGWGVVSYDIADPKTGQVSSTVTLQFPLQ